MAELIHNPAPQTASSKGMDEIIPKLWLGDILSTYNTDRIRNKGITHVISLIDQPLPQWLTTKYQALGIQHTVFMIEDDAVEDILAVMVSACDNIESTLKGGDGVLVHCGLGVSRSGSIVIGYLMRAQKKDRDQVFQFVQTKRPRVQPNSGFWEQLDIWQSYGYELWDDVEGAHVRKPRYAEWIIKGQEEMKERVRAMGERGQNPGHLIHQLNNFQLKPHKIKAKDMI